MGTNGFVVLHDAFGGSFIYELHNEFTGKYKNITEQIALKLQREKNIPMYDLYRWVRMPQEKKDKILKG